MYRTFTIVKQTTENKKIRDIVKVQTKASFMSLMSILSDPDISVYDKLFCTKYLLMTNDLKAMMALENFYLDIIPKEILEIRDRMLMIDEFSASRNGMMKPSTFQWIHDTTIEFFWTLFRQKIPLEYKIQCSQFLLWSGCQVFIYEAVFKEMMEYSRNATLTLEQKADIADLLIHSGFPLGKARGEEILDAIRYEEEKQGDQKERKKFVPKTVYDDGQNVHEATINDSIKKAIEILSEDEIKNPEITPIQVLEHISSVLSGKGYMTEKIRHALDRIATDQGHFTAKYRYRLRDILRRVWNRIMQMPPKISEEAIRRLVGELNDASGLCSTGHMSRIVNVLSGFSSEHGGLKVVSITWDAQIKANISARLNTRMRTIENEDRKGDVLNGMISSDEKERKMYLDFVGEMKESIKNELEQEFENVFDKDLENTEILSRENFLRIFDKSYEEFMV